MQVQAIFGHSATVTPLFGPICLLMGFPPRLSIPNFTNGHAFGSLVSAAFQIDRISKQQFYLGVIKCYTNTYPKTDGLQAHKGCPRKACY